MMTKADRVFRHYALGFLAAAAVSLIFVCAMFGYINDGSASFYTDVLHKTNKPGFSTTGQGCSGGSCHGAAPNGAITAAVSGPASLYPGQTGTYTLSTKETVSTNTPMGFDIAADDVNSLGLVSGEPAVLAVAPADPSGTSPEIVHSSTLRPITAAAPTVTDQFTYTMPSSAAVGGAHKLYAVSAAGFNGGFNFAPTFTVTTAAPPQASDLSISAITSSSFSASWTGIAPEFRAIYKASSLPADPTDGTLIVAGAFTAASVSGLAPNQRYFVAVYGKAAGVATYSSNAISTSLITLNGQTIDSNSRAGSGRTSNTSQGQMLFVDDPSVTDYLKLFDGGTTLNVEAKGTGQDVDFDDIGLGSGSAAGHVIAVWRRDQDDGHLSVDGGTPVLITGTNPFSPGTSMNLERLAIDSGCVYVALQSTSAATNVKNVYKVDPASGNAGNPLNTVVVAAGVTSRLITSDCKAAWAFDDASGSLKLQYSDGSPAVTADSGIGSAGLSAQPSIAHGKIVYVKQVSGIDQVFLYDTTAASPAPVQLTHYTDATMFIDNPQTDGRHVVWDRRNSGNTVSEIDFGGGITLASPVGALNSEPEMQLNRGQLLWKDASGNFRYETARTRTFLPFATTTYRPWLTDGFIAYGDSATPGAFLYSGIAPSDSQQPAAPMVVQATAAAGAITLNWDTVLGATSYNVYYANQAGVTKADYASLVGGTRLTGLTTPSLTIGVNANVPYYFVVTTVDPTGEGPESRQVSAININGPTWTSVGGLTSIAMFTAAADRTQLNAAYAAGGNNTYMSTDGGFTWTALGGGIGGANVRAIYADNGRVLATVPTGTIYSSTNGGTTWSTMLSASGIGETNQAIVVDPAVPTTILASDFQLPTYGALKDSYVIRSDDGGATWFHTPQSATPLGADLHAYSIAIDPTRTSTVYAGGTGTPNFAQSLAGGAGWRDEAVPATGTSSGYVYSLAVDPTNSQIIYAAV